MIKCEFENGNKANLRHVTVSVIVSKNNQILLGKRGNSTKKRVMLESGKWDLLGGFMDRDENIKQAAQRETLEESGYKLKNIKLFRINDNPNRPAEDRQNVEFIFIADASKKMGKNDREVTELKWFNINNIPSKSKIAFDHFENIQFYKKHLKKKLNLPIIG